MRRYAIILIAGQSRRFVQGDKCLALIRGKPIVLYSLEVFQRSGIFDHFIFVYRDETQREVLENHLRNHFPPEILSKILWILGGKERMFSVFNALKVIRERLSPEAFVFIHDGARPMLSIGNILAIDALLSLECGVVLAHRVTDTVAWIVAGEGDFLPRENVEIFENTPPVTQLLSDSCGKAQRRYLDRDKLWSLETPQAFYFPKIFVDYQRALGANRCLTDDSSLFSGTINFLENKSLNLKITSLRDLEFFEKFLTPSENGEIK
ncbi:MAG: 2-C-methyl-D-erythritol 4-phosphate cytidylyltransferase [Puniceicoccales bacterium]|jgi:2-C-methyl-D-erythritol 4-phosphate cytidylyltransferase|nr:2-C-methyl-D-erythritol 4-phosphate cytidylyltransferase [Puniceicoccales bacterium]